MKISYAITVCDEFIEFTKLFLFLLDHKRDEDEVVVLVDLTKNDDESELLVFLRELKSTHKITLVEDSFQGHFADWKNKLNRACKGDYIFQIDADEVPNRLLIKNLPRIVESNPDNEVYLVPRVNTVVGLTPEHIKKWGWNVNEQGWVNYPDYQWRIWKNDPKIKWKNKVHEVLEGHSKYATLPAMEDFSMYHPKDIERQEKQNNYYNTLQVNK
tara:strand:+ start:1317 stop:1958 length:642 start_codon:yes stop_codon:yes gene_type:complete